jgi:hypothetical protein
VRGGKIVDNGESWSMYFTVMKSAMDLLSIDDQAMRIRDAGLEAIPERGEMPASLFRAMRNSIFTTIIFAQAYVHLVQAIMVSAKELDEDLSHVIDALDRNFREAMQVMDDRLEDDDPPLYVYRNFLGGQ